MRRAGKAVSSAVSAAASDAEHLVASAADALEDIRA